MVIHRRVATSLSLGYWYFCLTLVGFTPSAKSDPIAPLPPLLYQSQPFETQPISETETIFYVTLTAEGIFPPVLTIPSGTTIRWTNQTSQTQSLEGTRFDTGLGPQTLFLPLILKDSGNQGNSMVGNNLTANNSLPGQDHLPG